jgi:tetratricopeptide (TPR) repeat protein
MSIRNVGLFFILAATPLFASDPGDNNSWSTWIGRADSLHRYGQFAEAAESGKRALAMAKSFGPSDSRRALSHYVLGSVYRDWGHCAEARANYTHAVALFEKQPDANSRYAFNAIASLIYTAGECEDFDGAEKLYRAHSAGLRRYRSGPFDDAKVLAIEAGISRGRKRYAEAEDYFRRALQLLEATSGSKVADIAEIRSSMALMMSHEGHYLESLAESERAIAALESVSPRYITLPAALNNAAYTLAQLERTEESAQMYRRALDLARDLFGEDNRNTAEIMMNYAVVLKRSKESPAAEALEKRGTDTYRRSLRRDTQTVDVEELGKGR